MLPLAPRRRRGEHREVGRRLWPAGCLSAVLVRVTGADPDSGASALPRVARRRRPLRSPTFRRALDGPGGLGAAQRLAALHDGLPDDGGRPRMGHRPEQLRRGRTTRAVSKGRHSPAPAPGGAGERKGGGPAPTYGPHASRRQASSPSLGGQTFQQRKTRAVPGSSVTQPPRTWTAP